MTELMRPQDLRKISSDADTAQAQEEQKRAQRIAEEQKGLREAFMGQQVRPDAKDRINAAIKRAAEQGQQEIQVLTFPASYCNDAGRRINNNLPDWPQSLEGFAKRAYDYYVAELQPLGFRLGIQVLDYPDGMPGTVGMSLKW
jgi:hypothetical protein